MVKHTIKLPKDFIRDHMISKIVDLRADLYRLLDKSNVYEPWFLLRDPIWSTIHAVVTSIQNEIMSAYEKDQDRSN